MNEKQGTSINQLGEIPIARLVLKYSLPAVVALLFNALYSFVDRLFIGNSVGAIGIAGIAVIFPLTQIIGSFASLIGMGASSLISRKLGEKDTKVSEGILGNALFMLITISIFITVVGLIFGDPILKFLGASKEVMPYAKAYLYIILLGTIFQVLSLGMNYFMRVDGSPQKAMATMLIGNVANLILAPIFIFVFNMGMQGAAIATVISQGISTLWVMFYFLSGKSFLKLTWMNIKLKVDIARNIFLIGLPSSFMLVSLSLANIIMNNSLTIYGGDIAVSVMGVINSILFIAILPIFGIMQGIIPIIGYNYGAKMFQRVRETLVLGMATAFVIATICFIAIMTIPNFLMTIFSNGDVHFISFGVYAIRISMMMVSLSGVPIIATGYFLATGNSKKAMLLTVCRNVFFMIPILIILPRFFKLEGVLFSTPLADLLAFIFTMVIYIPELKRLSKMEV